MQKDTTLEWWGKASVVHDAELKVDRELPREEGVEDRYEANIRNRAQPKHRGHR